MQWPISLLTLLEAWRARAEQAHSEVSDDSAIDVELADATPDHQGPAIPHRRAWCGLSSLANPKRDVDFAHRIGLTGLDIIVNDFSEDRIPRSFTIRHPQQIVTLATMARDAGLDVHLMTWLMPFKVHIKQAGPILVDIAKRCHAKSVVIDAEEPWTLAKSVPGYAPRMKYADAGELVRQYISAPLRDEGIELGVTGIRYASTAKLAPLVAVCDYMVPQCYSTKTSKADPSTVVSKGHATWRKKFGDGPRFVPGLAAYRQSGIKGHSIRSAMQAAIDNADDHADTVIFWGLNSLRKSPKTARAVDHMAHAPEF